MIRLLLSSAAAAAGLIGGMVPLSTAAAFDHSHAPFDRVLKAHVRDAAVDYAALRRDPKPLADYLDTLAAVPEADFNLWSQPERLAFLLNLYNAATLKLVADHYPVKSIKDIGGFLGSPWKQEVVRLFGKTTMLDHVEHGLVRKLYKEPRAHFAMVCAAKGCPPLRAESYTAARLDAQLNEQGRIFLAQAQKNRVEADRRVVHLSPIFKWFSEDFELPAGSVLKFVTPFFDEASRRALAGGKFSVRYTDYDWSLNEQSAK